jgi:hypothetical protein
VYLCLSYGDNNRPYIKLVKCHSNNKINEKNNQIIQFIINKKNQLVDKLHGLCLDTANGSIDNGVLFEFITCNNSNNKFKLNKGTGEIQLFDNDINNDINNEIDREIDRCITAGWPFLTGVSFSYTGNRDRDKGIDKDIDSELDRDKSKTTLIIQNEADINTNIMLVDTSKGDLYFNIDQRSIISVVY